MCDTNSNSIQLNQFMHPPILIYQMGKVGSNTVHKTLLASGIQNPVFHVHFLTKEKIYSNIKELEGKGFL